MSGRRPKPRPAPHPPRCHYCWTGLVTLIAPAEHRPASTPPNARPGPVWRCTCGTTLYGPP